MRKVVAAMLCSIIFFLSVTSVYAHEIYWTYSGSSISEVELRWIHKNSYTDRLKVVINTEYLSGSWSTYFEDARGAWHYSTVPAEFTTSTTAMNTYMATASSNYWSNRFPNDTWYSETVGVADLYDTNSTVITDYNSAYYSTKQINGANIYLKPNPSNNTAFQYRSTMSHELGHVLCLGHSHYYENNRANPVTDPSIMSYEFIALQESYDPQNHEVNDVKDMYGY